ncbi:RNA-guided endonuclease InsQ/TnpB family protein [Brevibacillus sp. NRS-1366]|uniref:RNA-guided endonuclease InsQ/TnpB family protein n=1 Tax=Brevibacillus sp. NRS-1366 TaxID=3233899 RepID=UPI003D254A0B
MQSLTVTIRIFPDQPHVLHQLGKEYIRIVNQLTEQAELLGSFPETTTKHVETILPSAVCNQAIRDAKSIFRKSKKLGVRPIFKKPVYFVNNQNYSLSENTVAFPTVVDGKTKKTAFHVTMTNRDRELLGKAKLGLMRVIEKSGKWYAQISLEVPTSESNSENVMGIDLGLKVPAVAVTSTGKTRFFRNGRQNKYIEGVSIVKIEQLENIRKTARTSRKNANNLHRWTFYQLQQFISYKANLAGIQVVEVDPAYTSQTCPACGDKNKARDRRYECSCGFHAHRDRVGAINIMHQPVADGNSLSA